MAVTRSTIAFNQENWKHIANVDNRSKLVNEALAYFLEAQKFLKEKEEEFILGHPISAKELSKQVKNYIRKHDDK